MDAILEGPEVEKLIHIKTLYLGPDELMVAAKIALPSDKTVRAAADDIDTIEARIRAAVPAARVIYLEPDVYRPALDPSPVDGHVRAALGGLTPPAREHGRSARQGARRSRRSPRRSG